MKGKTVTKMPVVKAFWDDEARVWVAESDDVPGLVAEAESLDNLVTKLKVLIPELLEENGHPGGEDIPFQLVGEISADYRQAA